MARYGGEEFVFIAPATNATHAQSQFGHVTASIGVASMIPLADGAAELLLKHADEALYRAKAAFRITQLALYYVLGKLPEP